MKEEKRRLLQKVRPSGARCLAHRHENRLRRGRRRQPPGPPTARGALPWSAPLPAASLPHPPGAADSEGSSGGSSLRTNPAGLSTRENTRHSAVTHGLLATNDAHSQGFPSRRKCGHRAGSAGNAADRLPAAGAAGWGGVRARLPRGERRAERSGGTRVGPARCGTREGTPAGVEGRRPPTRS